MAFASDAIEQIREQASIEQVVSRVVSLSPSGRPNVYKGLCPFHSEDTPSFTVNSNKNLFYCFGCQEGGDVFGFVQKTRGLSFMEAVRELAEECGIELREQSAEDKQKYQKRQSLYDVCQVAADFFHNQLLIQPQGKEAREYLAGRSVSLDAQRDFVLGYAPTSSEDFLTYMHNQQVSVEMLVDAGLARYRYPDKPRMGVYAMFRNRLMIPIRNAQGKVVAFGGRKLPSDTTSPAKYINSPETSIYKKSSVLYGLSFARSAIQKQKRVIIVEGYFDVITMHVNGFRETIATCGTALTEEHIKILRPMTSRSIALFDADEAGVRAAERSLPLFLQGGIEPLRLSLGAVKDPDEYFMVPENDAKQFEQLLNQAEPLFMTKLHQLIEKMGGSPGAKQEIVEEVMPLLKMMPMVARDASISMMASRLGLQDAAIRSQMSSRETVEPKHQYSSPLRGVSKPFSDLLWFLIHHPAKVRAIFSDVNPYLLTDNQNHLIVMGRLMQGIELNEVLEQIADESLRRLLIHQGITEGIYEFDQVDNALQQLRYRYLLQDINKKIQQSQTELARQTHHDVNLMMEQLNNLHQLRKEYEHLQNKLQLYKEKILRKNQ